MIENIEICIKFLAQLGVNVKEISAKDVHEGNLKSILTLFFNVSRYKQALRQSTPQCMPLNDLYGNKSTFGFPAPPPTPPQSSAPSSPSLAYTGFRSPPAVSTHPLMPYGRPFDFSGYVSDPGTQATVRLGLIPPPPPPSAGGLPSSPAALPPSREHVSPHCGVFPCSPGSSASSIVSLLSTASLPASTSNSNSNNISNASTTPSANMISRLPSSSSTGQAAFASSRLPSSGNPSTRLATSSSITGQLSTAANAACGFGGTTAGSSQKRISVPNKSNTSD
ncbi:Neuron navigator [Tyrophagus putrescentiae]|nr:Neuron navigator [Tyrophagus putrescentiae]